MRALKNSIFAALILALLPRTALALALAVSSAAVPVLNWTSTATGQAFYEVFLSTDGGNTFNSVTSTTSTSYVDTLNVLSCNTSYFYEVDAEDGSGNTLDASLAAPLVIPCAPQALSASVATGGVYLGWAAPAAGASSGYNVVWSSSPIFLSSTGWSALSVTLTTQDLFTLPLNASSLYFGVVNLDALGNSSAVAAVPAPFPQAPSGLSGTAVSGNGAVTLRWSAGTASPGVSTYSVFRTYDSGQPGASDLFATTTSTAATLSGLGNDGLPQYFWVGSNVAGLGSGSAAGGVSLTPFLTPVAPSGLTVSALNYAAGISISWTANAETGIPIGAYYLELDTGSGFQVAEVLGSQSLHAVLSAPCGVSCVVRVRAKDALGNFGAYALTVTASIPCAPVITASKLGATQMLLSWTAPSNPRVPLASSFAAYAGDPTLDDASFTAANAHTPSASSSAANLTVTGWALNQSQWIRAYVVDGNGVISAGSTDTQYLPPPAITTIRPRHQAAYLSWQSFTSTTRTPDVAGYAIYYDTVAPNRAYSSVTIVAAPASGKPGQLTITSLADGTPYYFAVATIGGQGGAGMQGSFSAVTQVSAGLPTPPLQGISQSLGGPLNLTWSAVDLGGLTFASYRIYRATTPDLSTGVSLTSTTKTFASVSPTGIVGQTDYYFIAVSTSSGVISSLSPSSSVAAIDNLDSPATIVATASGNSRVLLDWDLVAGVDAYQVYRSYFAPNPLTPPTALSDGLLQGTHYTDSNPFNGQINYYQVSARKLLPYNNSYIEGLPVSVTAFPVVNPGMPGFNGVTATNTVNYYLTVTASLSAVPAQSSVALSWAKAPAGSYLVSGYQAYAGQYIQGGSFPALGAVLPAPVSPSSYPLTLTDTGLTQGFTYTYSVVAVDTAGNTGAAIVRSFVLRPPLPPAGLSAAPLPISGEAALNWSPPASAFNPVRSYDIYVATGPNNNFGLLASLTGTTFVDSSALTLNSVFQHFYRIFSRDDLGLVSTDHFDGSSLVRPVPIVHVTPSVPTGFTATVQVSSTLGMPQVLLSWNPNSPQEAISLYNIQRQSPATFSTLGSVNSFVDTSMTSTPYGVTLTYTVQAQNLQGQSSPITITVDLYPPAPTGLAFSLDSNGDTSPGMSLSWNSLGAGADGYVLYRSLSPFNPLAATALTQTAATVFIDHSAVNGSSYEYRMATVAGGVTGTSSPTGPSATAGVAPDAVSAMQVLYPGTGIELTWNTTATGATPLKYWVFRDTSPLSMTPSASLKIAELNVSPAGSSNELIDNSAAVGIVYYYGVAGLNFNGRGMTVASGLASASSASPVGLVASAFASGGVPAVQLNWNAAQPLGPNTYNLYRSTNANFSPYDSIAGSITSTAFTDLTPTPNTLFYYQVSLGSPLSNPSYVSVTAYTAPGAVIGLTATAAATGVSLAWQPASSSQGVTGYSISYVHSGQPQGVTLSVGPVSSFAITGVPTAAFVAANVTALNSFGGGPVSVSVMARSNAAAAAFSPLSFTVHVGFPGAGIASRLDLSWVSAGDSSAFEIYRSLSPLTASQASGGSSNPFWLSEQGGGVTTTSDMSVSTTASYYYALSAVGPTGLPGGESYPVFSGQVQPFNEPSFLSFTVAVAGDSRVDLAWNPASPGSLPLNDLAYRVYRYTGGSLIGFKSVLPDSGFPVSLSLTSFTDFSAVNGSVYIYYVSVVDNQYHEQDNPSSVVLMPTAPSQPPLNLRFVAGNGQVTVQWLAIQANNAKYNIYRRDFSQDNYAVVPTLREQGPSQSNYNGVTVLVESVVDTTVVNKNTYCYTMAAVNSSGDSYKSEEFCVTPFNPLDASDKSITLMISGKKNAELDWVACADLSSNGGYAVQGYRIYRSQDGGSTFTALTTVASSSLTYTDSSTNFGRTYVYRVVPVDSFGNEGISYHVVIVSIPAPIDNVLVFKNSFNPAKNETVPIQYLLLSPGHAWVKIFTLQGQYVTTLFDEDVPSTASVATPYLSEKKLWDGRNAQGQIVASGVYLIHLEASGFRSNARVAVIK